ncbi:MAG: DUF4344 domain-containing metallopeptidase [Polyangiales bacterium]
MRLKTPTPVLVTLAAVMIGLATPTLAYAAGFSASAERPASPQHAGWGQRLVNSQQFRRMLAAANLVNLPHNVPIVVRSCGRVNAWYNRREQRISICYEYMERLRERLQRASRSGADVDARMLDATTLITMHEIGHAYVHQLSLRVSGSEEDAADQIAALLCLWGDRSGRDAMTAFRGAAALRQSGGGGGDAHAAGPARYRAISCLIYGQRPGERGVFVREGVLPAGRAASCPGEYSRASASWARTLRPFMRR